MLPYLKQFTLELVILVKPPNIIIILLKKKKTNQTFDFTEKPCI